MNGHQVTNQVVQDKLSTRIVLLTAFDDHEQVIHVKGMRNKEIATSSGIRQRTVKNHVTSILSKFGVEECTQAVVYALNRGWVKLSNISSQTQE